MALSDGMELFYEKTGCGRNENGHELKTECDKIAF